MGYSPWGCKGSDMTEQLTLSLSLLGCIFVPGSFSPARLYCPPGKGLGSCGVPSAWRSARQSELHCTEELINNPQSIKAADKEEHGLKVFGVNQQTLRAEYTEDFHEMGTSERIL